MLSSLCSGTEHQTGYSETEHQTGFSDQLSTGLDVLAEACQAANLQMEPKKPAQTRQKKVTVTGGELAHDDFCREPLKCTIRWELAKIQRKRTYDRLHQANRTLTKKLGEVTLVSEARKRKLVEVTTESEARMRKLAEVTAESEARMKKLIEVTAESEARMRKLRDVTAENERLKALLLNH